MAYSVWFWYWFWFWTAIAAAGAAAALVLVLVSRVRVRVRCSMDDSNFHLVLIVHALFGIVRLERDLPQLIEWKNKSKSAARRRIEPSLLRLKRDIKRSPRRVWHKAQQMLSRVECTRWRFDCRVGTGDAAATAIVSGLLWSACGWAAAMTGRLTRLAAKPHGTVAANYKAEEFALVWEADFRIRLGSALWTIFRLGRT